MQTEAETGRIVPKPRNAQGHQNLEEASKESPPKPERKHSPADTLTLESSL